jgi:hypothetical protein
LSTEASAIEPMESMSEDDAVAAIMESLEPPKAPGNDEDEGDDADEQPLPDDDQDPLDEDGDEPDPDDADEGEGDPNTPAAPAAPADDAQVIIDIGGEQKTFTVAQLKEFATQGAEVTQRFQEADEVGGRAAAALQAAIEVAQEDLAPYADVDWLVLQNRLSPEEFEWHRENAQKADAKYRKVLEKAQTFQQAAEQRQTAEHGRRAQEAVKVLQKDIPGWSEQLYGDILDYGASQGLDQGDLSRITDPGVIKVLHQALLYSKGQKVAAKKVAAAPTKVLKPGTRDVPPEKAIAAKKAERRLAQGSGSDDDAVAVLMGRWR